VEKRRRSFYTDRACGRLPPREPRALAVMPCCERNSLCVAFFHGSRAGRAPSRGLGPTEVVAVANSVTIKLNSQ
jgi:hypothetical protein